MRSSRFRRRRRRSSEEVSEEEEEEGEGGRRFFSRSFSTFLRVRRRSAAHVPQMFFSLSLMIGLLLCFTLSVISASMVPVSALALSAAALQSNSTKPKRDGLKSDPANFTYVTLPAMLKKSATTEGPAHVARNTSSNATSTLVS